MKDINIDDFIVKSKILVSERSTTFDLGIDEDETKDQLRKVRKKLGKLQDKMYAHGKYAALICPAAGLL